MGYGVAYPYSMIGIVLLIQFLPKLLRRQISAEEARYLEEKAAESPGLQARQFRVTNPNIDGLTVAQINPRRLAQVNISRIKRAGQVQAAMPETVLRLGDVVMAVGTPDLARKTASADWRRDR